MEQILDQSEKTKRFFSQREIEFLKRSFLKFRNESWASQSLENGIIVNFVLFSVSKAEVI